MIVNHNDAVRELKETETDYIRIRRTLSCANDQNLMSDLRASLLMAHSSRGAAHLPDLHHVFDTFHHDVQRVVDNVAEGVGLTTADQGQFANDSSTLEAHLEATTHDLAVHHTREWTQRRQTSYASGVKSSQGAA